MRRIVFICLLLIGCSQSKPTSGSWDGLKSPVMLSNEPWTYNGQSAQRLHTPHYTINTTIGDEQFLKQLAQVLEGALEQYRKFTPDIPLTARPMDCYIFANRSQWSDFTRHHTGADAPVYLKINRGGFTLRDWY